VEQMIAVSGQDTCMIILILHINIWVKLYLVTMFLITRGMDTGGLLFLDVSEFLILSIELASRRKSNSYPIF
jgi:hypothetical protein